MLDGELQLCQLSEVPVDSSKMNATAAVAIDLDVNDSGDVSTTAAEGVVPNDDSVDSDFNGGRTRKLVLKSIVTGIKLEKGVKGSRNNGKDELAIGYEAVLQKHLVKVNSQIDVEEVVEEVVLQTLTGTLRVLNASPLVMGSIKRTSKTGSGAQAGDLATLGSFPTQSELDAASRDLDGATEPNKESGKARM